MKNYDHYVIRRVVNGVAVEPEEALQDAAKEAGEAVIRQWMSERGVSRKTLEEMIKNKGSGRPTSPMLGGDGRPWWEKKGYSECPMAHE